jgi:HSP20 family protein
MPCDPLRDLRAWQERLERLSAQHGTAWAPPIDVYETEDRYVVTAEVPGVSREAVDVAVQDNRLMLRGARRTSTRWNAATARSNGRFTSPSPC